MSGLDAEMPTHQEYHELARKALREAAESMRQAHHAAACQENSELYKLSEIAFKATLTAAYPEIGGQALYNLWVDSMEDIAYYVALWAKMDDEEREHWRRW